MYLPYLYKNRWPGAFFDPLTSDNPLLGATCARNGHVTILSYTSNTSFCLTKNLSKHRVRIPSTRQQHGLQRSRLTRHFSGCTRAQFRLRVRVNVVQWCRRPHLADMTVREWGMKSFIAETFRHNIRHVVVCQYTHPFF